LKSLDIDITYYLGSQWEAPNESFIPLSDIPTLDYRSEGRMTAVPGGIDTFTHALKTNLSQLIQFCSSVQNKKTFKHYHRPISTQLHQNNSFIR
jgi:hypothetical protein